MHLGLNMKQRSANEVKANYHEFYHELFFKEFVDNSW